MENEPISFDTRDEYQRKPIAESVIHLLSSDIQVSPMVIDGDWGTGKTEFCRKLIHLIDNGDSNFIPVYIDAFKADHADEPLMTILAAILKLLPEADRPSLIQKALPAVRFGIKTGLKAGVSWLLKQDAADIADGFDDDLKKAGDQVVNHAIESLLSDHVASDESIQTLKTALAEVASESPIVIFIDELDRCRPDFAVSMMENIKHIFDVDNVQFVLATNSTQLRASINHCYGDAIESDRYLDKFIGYSFTLPQIYKADGYRLTHASVLHMESLIQSSELLQNTDLSGSGYLDFINSLIKINGLSLREVETFSRYMEIYQILTSKQGLKKSTVYGYGILRVFGIYLFCFKPDISEELTQEIINVKAIAAVLGKQKLRDLSDRLHPDHGDVIIAMAGLEATTESSGFVPEGTEIIQGWEAHIRSFFARGVFQPDVGERTKIITDVIDTLKLRGA